MVLMIHVAQHIHGEDFVKARAAIKGALKPNGRLLVSGPPTRARKAGCSSCSVSDPPSPRIWWTTPMRIEARSPRRPRF